VEGRVIATSSVLFKEPGRAVRGRIKPAAQPQSQFKPRQHGRDFIAGPPADPCWRHARGFSHTWPVLPPVLRNSTRLRSQAPVHVAPNPAFDAAKKTPPGSTAKTGSHKTEAGEGCDEGPAAHWQSTGERQADQPNTRPGGDQARSLDSPGEKPGRHRVGGKLLKGRWSSAPDRVGTGRPDPCGRTAESRGREELGLRTAPFAVPPRTLRGRNYSRSRALSTWTINRVVGADQWPSRLTLLAAGRRWPSSSKNGLRPSGNRHAPDIGEARSRSRTKSACDTSIHPRFRQISTALRSSQPRQPAAAITSIDVLTGERTGDFPACWAISHALFSATLRQGFEASS